MYGLPPDSPPSEAAAGQPSRVERTLTVALVLLPWVVLVFLFAHPRPYWVFETDSEADYYYNALLILKNGVPRGFLHPGTPVYYLVAALVAFVGPAVELTQRCLNVGYVVIVALSSWMIWLTLRSCESGKRGAAIAGLAVVLAWPPVVTHWGYLGSDPFIPIVGVPVVLAAYRALRLRTAGTARHTPSLPLGGVAAAFGFCLALKLSFLPVALAFLTAAGTRRWASSAAEGQATVRRLAAVSRSVAALMGAMLGTFLICTLPSLPRLPATVLGNFSRSDVRPGGNVLVAFASGVAAIFRQAPMVGLAFAVLGLSLAWAAISALPFIGRRVRSGATLSSSLSGGDGPRLVFLALAWLGLAYSVSAAAGDVARGWDVGLLVRNATPSALIALPTVLFLAEHLPGLAAWLRRPVAVPAVVALVLLPAAVTTLVVRHRTVAERLQRIALTSQTLDEMRAGKPVALWDSVGDQGGPAAFHHWGNYRYGADQFDRVLLRAFPDQGFVRLREVDRIWRAGDGSQRTAALGRVARLSERWTRMFPSSVRRPSDDVLSGQILGFQPGIVAFPVGAEPEMGPRSVEDLLTVLGRGFDSVNASTTVIAGQSWRVIRLGAAAKPPTVLSTRPTIPGRDGLPRPDHGVIAAQRD